MFPVDPITSKALVCIVDANPAYRQDVARALTSFYDVVEFAEQNEALEAIAFNMPAAVVLDENVLPRGGLPLLREICCVPDLDRVPIICTATSHRTHFLGDAIGLGVRTTLVKPFRRSVLLQALSREINGKVERSWGRIEPVQRAALKRTLKAFNGVADAIGEGLPIPYEPVREACGPLVQAVECGQYRDMLHGIRHHDNYTYAHSLRVAIFLSTFGHAIGVRGDDLMILATGGLLHDIGKMAVPYRILNKTGRLTDEELEIVRGHVIASRDFLSKGGQIPHGTQVIAEQHHEKVDGSGYPLGLKGPALNDLARMAAIVDIFGALTDRRVYKEPVEPELVLHIMTEMGGVLDQHLLGMFRSLLLDTAETVR